MFFNLPLRYIFIALFAGGIWYHGYTTGVDNTTETYEAKIAKERQQHEKVIRDVSTQTKSVSTDVLNTLTTINDNREKSHEKTDDKLSSLLDKYAYTNVQRVSDTTHTHRSKLTSLRTPAITVVVAQPDDWPFSGKDREFILREAARADKITEELNQCKVYLRGIYSSHDTYRKIVDDYLYNNK